MCHTALRQIFYWMRKNRSCTELVRSSDFLSHVIPKLCSYSRKLACKLAITQPLYALDEERKTFSNTVVV